MPVRLNNSHVHGGCASTSRRSATRPRSPTSSSFRDDSDATRKHSRMMSTDTLERILPDSSGEPEPPDDAGEPSLNTGDDQPAADDADAPVDSADAEGAADTTGRDDTGPPERLRTRLARLLAHVILPAAALLLACAAGYLQWGEGTAPAPGGAR